MAIGEPVSRTLSKLICLGNRTLLSSSAPSWLFELSPKPNTFRFEVSTRVWRRPHASEIVQLPINSTTFRGVVWEARVPWPNQGWAFFVCAIISRVLRIRMEHDEMKNSLDSELQIDSKCSIRILDTQGVIAKTKFSKIVKCKTLGLIVHLRHGPR